MPSPSMGSTGRTRKLTNGQNFELSSDWSVTLCESIAITSAPLILSPLTNSLPLIDGGILSVKKFLNFQRGKRFC
jgi:hypothetical protein